MGKDIKVILVRDCKVDKGFWGKYLKCQEILLDTYLFMVYDSKGVSQSIYKIG